MDDFDQAQRTADEYAKQRYGPEAATPKIERREPHVIVPWGLDQEKANIYAWTALVPTPGGGAERITILHSPQGWYVFPVERVSA